MDIFGNTLNIGNTVAYAHRDRSNGMDMSTAVIDAVDWDTNVLTLRDEQGNRFEVEAHLVVKSPA